MTERKPGAGFFVAVVCSAALLLYPLAFGPSVWLASRERVGGNVVTEDSSLGKLLICRN